MYTPNAYKLKVNYQYAEEYMPIMQKVAENKSEQLCKCSKCGIPYLTSREYKQTDLCTWCSGHCATRDEVKHQKHLEYQRKRARDRRQA